MIDYDIQKDGWFSPKVVITEFNKLIKVFGEDAMKKDKHLFGRGFEMFVGAVTLLGLYKMNHENIYLIQSNNQTATPDVYAAIYKPSEDNDGLVPLVQIEHVGMGQFSTTDDAFTFLKQTKLSSTKSYTEADLIVLEVNRKISLNLSELGKKLHDLNPKPTIYILGHIRETREFVLQSPYPKFSELTRFKIRDVLMSYSIPDRVYYYRSAQRSLKPASSYEVLGLDKNAILKKYNRS
jgi:hypothetical protein